MFISNAKQALGEGKDGTLLGLLGYHRFSLIDESELPLVMSFLGFCLMVGLVLWFHGEPQALGFVIVGLLVGGFSWGRSLVEEGRFFSEEGASNIRIGMLLFIVTEVMFFFSFFFAYFYYVSWCTVDVFTPALGFPYVSSAQLSAVLTVILLLSASYLNCGMAALSMVLPGEAVVVASEGSVEAERHLKVTIILGLLFLVCQGYEYFMLSFNLNDGVFGSIFYMITGLHGFHVFVGVVFLIVCYARVYSGVSLALECAGWYWHFVDYVWLGVYMFLYDWRDFHGNVLLLSIADICKCVYVIGFLGVLLAKVIIGKVVVVGMFRNRLLSWS